MICLARLHRDVVFGKSKGQIIWQPRIQCWYHDKKFAGEQLPAPYTNMTLPDIYRQLGCSDRLYQWYNPCFRRIEPSSVRRIEKKLNETDTQIVVETPVGKQVMVNRRTPSSPREIHVKREVESEEELKVATWIEENTTWKWDQDQFNRSWKEVGDLGAPVMYMPRMNVQDLYINKMGVEKGVYALYDWPETVKAYFQALEESHDRLMDVINVSPVEIINFGENIHSGTLSPDLFLKYHLPACQHRCERLHAAGKFVSCHWDGNCRPLLRFVQETGLDGIEAITPRPQGDVTIEEIKEALKNNIFLLDGIPAILFDKIFPVEELKECVCRLIELFAPKLVLGISDELSSSGDMERVCMVGDIVKEYNSQHE